MNDDLMSRLDDRGRSAGAAAHGAVAELPIPDFDPDLVRVSLDDDPTTGAAGRGGRGDRRWLAVVGIAAALLVVALGAALVSRAGDDDSAPTDNVGTTDQVRPYVAGWLPEGLELSDLSDGGSGDTFEMVLFGPSTDDVRIGISVLTDMTSIADQIAEATELGEGYVPYRSIGSAGGRDVFANDEGASTYAFDEGDRQVWLLVAPGVTKEEVLTTVAEIELDGDDAIVVDEPPSEWERVGVLEDSFFVFGTAGGGVGRSRYVYYSTPIPPTGVDDDEVSIVMIAASRGTSLDVAAARLFGGSSEEVVVRGRPGILARIEPYDDSVTAEELVLTWEERPGEIVRVMGVGLGRDELLAVAEDVRPVAEDEWDEVAREVALTPRQGEELVGSGAFSDGSPWALFVQDDGDGGSWTSLRSSIQTDGSHGSSGSGVGQAVGDDGEPIETAMPALSDVTREGGGGLAWAYGLLDRTSGASVARVVVEDASGAVVAEAVLVGDGDLRGWVVELPPGLVPPDDGSDGDVAGSSQVTGTTYMEGVATTAGSGDVEGEEVDGPTVVAYAADGTELARQPLP